MHIQEESVNAFRSNTMDTEELIEFLEHLDNCNYCLDVLAQAEEEQSAIQAPGYLKEQILTQAASPAFLASKSISQTSRKIQLLYYGLHTAVGVITALFLLFCIGQIDFTEVRFSSSNQFTWETQIPAQPDHSSQFIDFSRDLGDGISGSAQKIARELKNVTKIILNGGK